MFTLFWLWDTSSAFQHFSLRKCLCRSQNHKEHLNQTALPLYKIYIPEFPQISLSRAHAVMHFCGILFLAANSSYVLPIEVTCLSWIEELNKYRKQQAQTWGLQIWVTPLSQLETKKKNLIRDSYVTTFLLYNPSYKSLINECINLD